MSFCFDRKTITIFGAYGKGWSQSDGGDFTVSFALPGDDVFRERKETIVEIIEEREAAFNELNTLRAKLADALDRIDDLCAQIDDLKADIRYLEETP